MNLPGSITISRVHDSERGDFIEVRLEDERSGIRFVDAEMSLEAFALAVTNQGFVPCQLELRGLDKVGMDYQHKTETVFVPDGEWKQRHETAEKAIKPFEVDGWRGDTQDAMNSNKWVRKEPPKGKSGHWYTVVFRRHVPHLERAEKE